ncbi:hypothetical protein A3852_20860 [Rhodococcus qingshengii]|nr:hypothetical protein A3852_20860 [Rhodococcus qingshengii]
MILDTSCFKLTVESAHQASGLDRRSFCLSTERVTHPLKQCDKRDVLIKSKLDGLKTVRQVCTTVTHDMFMGKEFGVDTA